MLTATKNLFIIQKQQKKNKDLHGWGFPSVMDAVQKYNGSLKCVNKDNQFIVKIVLFFLKNS